VARSPLLALACAAPASAGGEPPFVGCHVGLAPASATSKTVNFVLDCEDGGLTGNASIVFRMSGQLPTSVKSPNGLDCSVQANLVVCQNASSKTANAVFRSSFTTQNGAACGTSKALKLQVSGGTNTTVQGPCLLSMAIRPSGNLRANSRTCFSIKVTSSGGIAAKGVKITMPDASATTNSQGFAAPCARIPTPPMNVDDCINDIDACFFSITAKGTGYTTVSASIAINNS